MGKPEREKWVERQGALEHPSSMCSLDMPSPPGEGQGTEVLANAPKKGSEAQKE